VGGDVAEVVVVVVVVGVAVEAVVVGKTGCIVAPEDEMIPAGYDFELEIATRKKHM